MLDEISSLNSESKQKMSLHSDNDSLHAVTPPGNPKPEVDTLEECSSACCFYCSPVSYVFCYLWAVSLEIYSFFLPAKSKIALFTEQKIPEFFPPEVKTVAQTFLMNFFMHAIEKLEDPADLQNIQVPKALEETEFADRCLEKMRQCRSRVS
jgi:hypothetical protein